MQRWWAARGREGTTMLDRMRQVDHLVAPTCRAVVDGFAAVVNGDA